MVLPDAIESVTHVELNGDKLISMMRGKSPQSNVEMSKKRNFVAAILYFGGHLGLTMGTYLISLYSI